MEGPYKLLQAQQAKWMNRACLAGRSLYGPSMSDFLGFQTKYIWNPWGIPVHPAQLVLLYLSTLLDSWLAHCVTVKWKNLILRGFLELPPEEDPTYIQIMMSVPYNLNSYNAYLAVGVDTMYLNSTGLFDHLYYYSGPFERAPAGSLVEFTPEGGKGTFIVS